MNIKLIPQLIEILSQGGQQLCSAESCTGGMVGQFITSVPGASTVYRGGVISYSNESKQKLLKVPTRVLERYGAVSEQCAHYMAKNVQKLFGTDWSLSITGIAGPSGATPGKPLGYVCFGWSSPQGTTSESVKFLYTDRNTVRTQAAEYSLTRLLKLIKSSS